MNIAYENKSMFRDYCDRRYTNLGYKIIVSCYPIVSLILKDTIKTAELVNHLFENVYLL